MRASWIMMMALTAFALAACENSSLTDECTTADDCNGGLDGTCGWICEDGHCEVECMGDCETDADCNDGFDAGCPSYCVNGHCKPDCPDHCFTATDCEDLTWPIDCDGHWECNAGTCEAVCDT